MATSRRVSRVSSLIKREVSLMLLYDIKDDRVGAGMVSVTRVDVSGDLQHAKIYISVYGTPEAKAETMAGLHSSASFVRRALGQRMRLRRTPEISFLADESLAQGDQILNLINNLPQPKGDPDSLNPQEEAGVDPTQEADIPAAEETSV